MVFNNETEREGMSESTLPLPIPALLAAHTRMEGGDEQVGPEKVTTQSKAMI